MEHAWGRKRMYTGLWRESQKEIDHYEDLDEMIILNWILENYNEALAQGRDQ
jgi:hypothetical protein